MLTFRLSTSFTEDSSVSSGNTSQFLSLPSAWTSQSWRISWTERLPCHSLIWGEKAILSDVFGRLRVMRLSAPPQSSAHRFTVPSLTNIFRWFFSCPMTIGVPSTLTRRVPKRGLGLSFPKGSNCSSSFSVSNVKSESLVSNSSSSFGCKSSAVKCSAAYALKACLNLGMFFVLSVNPAAAACPPCFRSNSVQATKLSARFMPSIHRPEPVASSPSIARITTGLWNVFIKRPAVIPTTPFSFPSTAFFSFSFHASLAASFHLSLATTIPTVSSSISFSIILDASS